LGAGVLRNIQKLEVFEFLSPAHSRAQPYLSAAVKARSERWHWSPRMSVKLYGFGQSKVHRNRSTRFLKYRIRNSIHKSIRHGLLSLRYQRACQSKNHNKNHGLQKTMLKSYKSTASCSSQLHTAAQTTVQIVTHNRLRMLVYKIIYKNIGILLPI
jgi:hypothetical protein